MKPREEINQTILGIITVALSDCSNVGSEKSLLILCGKEHCRNLHYAVTTVRTNSTCGCYC